MYNSLPKGIRKDKRAAHNRRFLHATYVTSYNLFIFLVVNCGAPPAIANGQISGSDYSYDAKVTYSCNAANFKLSGSQERTCQADGTWSGTQPACLGEYWG